MFDRVGPTYHLHLLPQASGDGGECLVLFLPTQGCQPTRRRARLLCLFANRTQTDS